MTVQEWLGKDNQLGIDIWNKKYRYKNEDFEQWLNRVSGGNENIKQLIREKKFLFGGRILSNRGLDKDGVKSSLSNCYVITPPEDNIESIFECAAKMARTFSYGGGCGTDLSKLAPRGAKVNNTAKETSGAVSFMDLYSTVTGLIGQNGRRGALMLSLDCSHPDIEEFIGIKSDLNRVTKANISVKITDEFMRAVESDSDFALSFTREATGETITKTVKARELFHKIAEMNWNYAEPGALFWDRIAGYNMLANTSEFEFSGTNPCAEEPLPAGGSCLLGSINLAEFVLDGEFQYDDFDNAVRVAIWALNDVLDEGLPLHPLQEQRDSVKKWRQIGLGIMGLADMLIKMQITYGSSEAVIFCEELATRMFKQAFTASNLLSLNEPDKVCALDFTTAINTEFASNQDLVGQYTKFTDEDSDFLNNHHLANSQLLTIAPTGTLSTMLGISGGIEPIFANYYERKTESLHNKDVYYKVYTPIVERYMKENGIVDDEKLPPYFVTSKDIDYIDRIAMQAAWQRHIDASISSTVNLPESATVEDVECLYLTAWRAGLKGITIFREGCKRTGVLTTDQHTETISEPQTFPRGFIMPKSDDLVGKLRTLTTGCGSLHVTAFFDPFTGDFVHTFLSKGSRGGCQNFMVGLSRMISLAARGGVSLEDIVDQLNSCGSCSSYAVRSATQHDTSKGSCCPMAIGNALIDMHHEMMREISEDEPEEKPEPVKPIKPVKKASNPCPLCGEELIFEGGCNSCKACGYSRCS